MDSPLPASAPSRPRRFARPYSVQRVMVAAAGSTFGDGVLVVTLPLLATQLTNDPRLIGGLVAVERGAWLFALLTGALADRFSRVHTMIVADLVRGSLLAVLALLIANDRLHSLWPLFGLAFVMGLCTSAFYAASNALLPEIAGDKALVRAYSRLTLVGAVAENFAGKAAGGHLFAWSRHLPFTVDAVTFAFSAVGLATVRERRRNRAREPLPPHWVRTDMQRAVQWLTSDRELRSLTVFIALMATTQYMFMSVLVLFGLRELGLGFTAVGFFAASSSIGDLAGAFMAPRILTRIGLGRYLPIAVAVSAMGALVTGAFPITVVAAAALVVEGFAVASANVMTSAARQRLMPDAHRGALNNLIRMTIYAGIPVGAVLGGFIADRWGLRWPFVVAGVLQLALVPFVVRTFRSSRFLVDDEVVGD